MRSKFQIHFDAEKKYSINSISIRMHETLTVLARTKCITGSKMKNMKDTKYVWKERLCARAKKEKENAKRTNEVDDAK